MSNRTRLVATIAGSAAVGVGLLVATRNRVKRQTSREVEELFAASRGPRLTIVTEADLAGLPEPVGRWLRYSGVVGKPRPTTTLFRSRYWSVPWLISGWYGV